MNANNMYAHCVYTPNQRLYTQHAARQVPPSPECGSIPLLPCMVLRVWGLVRFRVAVLKLNNMEDFKIEDFTWKPNDEISCKLWDVILKNFISRQNSIRAEITKKWAEIPYKTSTSTLCTSALDIQKLHSKMAQLKDDFMIIAFIFQDNCTLV